MTLYKNRQEFKQHNKSAPWAEAYYQAPTCFAYFAADERNPYHWMIHEATHQLNHEVARIARPDWVDEGLATYFGTSQIGDGKLVPGSVDVDTYPIWWLSGLELTGELPVDIATGNIVSLRVLVSGAGGSDIAQAVNKYYLGYWSLTHFLLDFDNGRYADEYREVIAAGGNLEQFEKKIGPIDRIEVEWYGYLRHLKSELE